ncbi:hypothetical protein Tco_0699278 [Tanacetum coccineum]
MGHRLRGRVLFKFNVWVPIGKCNRVLERQKKLRNQIFRALTASADVPSSVTETTDTTSTLPPPPPPLQKPTDDALVTEQLPEPESEMHKPKIMADPNDDISVIEEIPAQPKVDVSEPNVNGHAEPEVVVDVAAQDDEVVNADSHEDPRLYQRSLSNCSDTAKHDDTDPNDAYLVKGYGVCDAWTRSAIASRS